MICAPYASTSYVAPKPTPATVLFSVYSDILYVAVAFTNQLFGLYWPYRNIVLVSISVLTPSAWTSVLLNAKPPPIVHLLSISVSAPSATPRVYPWNASANLDLLNNPWIQKPFSWLLSSPPARPTEIPPVIRPDVNDRTWFWTELAATWATGLSVGFSFLVSRSIYSTSPAFSASCNAKETWCALPLFALARPATAPAAWVEIPTVSAISATDLVTILTPFTSIPAIS